MTRWPLLLGVFACLALGTLLGVAAANVTVPLPPPTLTVATGHLGDRLTYVQVQARATVSPAFPGVELPAELAPDARAWSLIYVDSLEVEDVRRLPSADGRGADHLIVARNQTKAQYDPRVLGGGNVTVGITEAMYHHPALVTREGKSLREAVDLESRHSARRDEGTGWGTRLTTYADRPSVVPGLLLQGRTLAVGQALETHASWRDECRPQPNVGAWWDAVPLFPDANTSTTVARAGRLDGRDAVAVETFTEWTGHRSLAPTLSGYHDQFGEHLTLKPRPPGTQPNDLPVTVRLTVALWFREGDAYPALVECRAEGDAHVRLRAGGAFLVGENAFGVLASTTPPPTASTTLTRTVSRFSGPTRAAAATLQATGNFTATFYDTANGTWVTDVWNETWAYGEPVTFPLREARRVLSALEAGSGRAIPWGEANRDVPPAPDPAAERSTGPPGAPADGAASPLRYGLGPALEDLGAATTLTAWPARRCTRSAGPRSGLRS